MRCPICDQPSANCESPDQPSLFPFCSERCKLIDLGRWLSGRYQIPVREQDQDSSDLPDRPAADDDQ